MYQWHFQQAYMFLKILQVKIISNEIGQYIVETPCEVKVTQLYLTLSGSMDYIVHGILHTRLLEWVAITFSRGSSPYKTPTLSESCGCCL